MRHILIAIVSCASLMSARAQDATPLSLKECTDYALKHNYTVKNAQLDILIQQAQNNQVLSASRPHINGKAELDDFLAPQKTFIEAKNFNPNAPAGQIVGFAFALDYGGSASVSASQLIFDGGVFIALKARNSVMELARRNEQVSEETVRYNVYKAYYSLVIAHRQFDNLKTSLAFIRNVERDYEIMRKNGVAEKIEVERTSVQVINLATDSLRIANMLAVSEQMLKFQMGMDINKPIVLTDTTLDENMTGTLALMNEQQQYDRIPTYNVLTTALTLNEYNLKRYQLQALPSLAAFGAAGYNYAAIKFRDIVSFSNYAFNSMVGLTLNVPIYNGGMRTNQVREAKLNIEKSKNNIENMKQAIDFQVATSRTSMRNAILQVQSQKKNMELSNDVLDLAQRKYKAGVGSNMEVTQAQTEQQRAQNNYYIALLDVINAEADLKKALGLLK